MDVNRWIEGAVWVVSFGLLLLIPRLKVREALMGFLFMQVPTWLLGALVVQYGLVEYPSRFFARGISTSFTYEFMAFPVVSALFNVYYPQARSVWHRAGYLMAYTTPLTAVEAVLERYTQLVRYVHWSWWCSWVSISLTLMVSYWFCKWFFYGTLRSGIPDSKA